MEREGRESNILDNKMNIILTLPSHKLLPTSCQMCNVNIKYEKVYAMLCNVSTRIRTRSISCYYYFSFDHAKLQLELEIMSVLSINYQVCLAHEILLLNSSAFLMTTFHFELHYKGRFEERINKGHREVFSISFLPPSPFPPYKE